MAARTRAPRLDRASRLSALEACTRRPPAESDPRIGELRENVDQAAQAVLDTWLAALVSPPGSADRAAVCCMIHALRRVWSWLRATGPLTAADLSLIEQAYLCG